MRALVTALVAALALLLAGCAPPSGEPPVRPSNVDVDTPKLQRLKQQVGMAGCPRLPQRPSVEEGLPELTLPCLGGGRDVEMSALRGPLLINVWQSFCGPCIEEMPVLQEFHQRYGDRVAVLGIDYQDTRPQAALDLARETGAQYPSVADPGGNLNGRGAFPVLRGLPFFVLVDESGKIVHVEAGGVEELSDVVSMVEDHLGVRL